MEIELDESLIEAEAVLAASAAMATPVMPPPDGSRERDRDAGAETDVETDGVRLGQSLRRRPVPSASGDVNMEMDDVDEEMEDINDHMQQQPLPALPEDLDDEDEDGSVPSRGRSADMEREDSASPMSLPRRSSEWDGEGSGNINGSGDVALDAEGAALEAIVNGKRKR